MIAFDLQCGNKHVFEGWFRDEKTFRQQGKKQMIECPICGDTRIVRIPSTFGIVKAGSSRKESSAPTPESSSTEPSPAEMQALYTKLVDFVNDNFDNVGCDFTKEALKIHYGVSEPRNIRGVSSTEEEKQLQEEGVPFLKFPMPVKPDTDA
jgi:hypothetical protein